VFISQHLLEIIRRSPPTAIAHHGIDRGRANLPWPASTRYLFNRANSTEVWQPEQRLPSIPTYRSIQPTHRILQPFLQGNDASLQLVPASTTTKANTAGRNKFVDLQTTGVGSTGVHVPSPPRTTKQENELVLQECSATQRATNRNTRRH
jgi:hypothetical protein